MEPDKSENKRTRPVNPTYDSKYICQGSNNSDEDPWVFLKATLILGATLGIVFGTMVVITLVQKYIGSTC